MYLRANTFSLWLFSLGMASCLSLAAAPVKMDLDTVINWDSPEIVSISAVEDLMLPLREYRKEYKGDAEAPGDSCTWQSFSPKDFQFSFFGEEMELEAVHLGRSSRGNASFSFRTPSNKKSPGLEHRIERQVTDKMRVVARKEVFPGGKRTVVTWRNQNWMVMLGTRLEGSKGEREIELDILKLNSADTTKPAAPAQVIVMDVNVDLDFLLNLGELWNCTADDFEKIYRAKKGTDQEQPPQFEWLSEDRSRARFSRKLFSNLEVKMTLFAKSTKVDEAIVEFVNGRAARVTISLYNRGDSGDIQPDLFDQIYKTTGKNLGQVMKVAPRNISQTTTSAVKTVSWQWSSPVGIALLEHNDYRTGRSVGKPEFLRMKLANPQQADWSIGKLTVGVQRMALMKNITKMDNGDVYISGVPMVDQGTKGYCVAASCQRLFEYMQIPCDQHEIAQLADVDSQSGVDIFTMQKSLGRIDGHYKVMFKPHINPEQFYGANRKRRISQRQFAVIIKEHVDKAVPLLWALELGRFPENPPLPNGGQVSGGHMRMIIGYNSATQEVIFSDSWGAGHEIKRMSESGAYEATVGLYTMSPRGL
ncbi:C39 family peptidase [Prosthecobacter sp. SYSU 5D2]|uniref:C39 family peptidase n=1 Tax=Prosthecobacter sp. SYSU 5D2 TaxID=3134134 RepID=UPI0031FF1888